LGPEKLTPEVCVMGPKSGSGFAASVSWIYLTCNLSGKTYKAFIHISDKDVVEGPSERGETVFWSSFRQLHLQSATTFTCMGIQVVKQLIHQLHIS
jgi:hypothetical protein